MPEKLQKQVSTASVFKDTFITHQILFDTPTLSVRDDL